MWAVFTHMEFGGWVNCWHDEYGLQHYDNRAQAEAALDEHMEDMAKSVAAGHMTDCPPRSDYLVAPVRAVLHVASMEELGDLIDWMVSHQTDDDWPLMTEDAAQWLCTLEVGGEHIVAPKHIEPILYALLDWEEVLSSHDDSDPFHTELIEVPME